MTPSTLHRSHRPASARTPPPAAWPLLGTVAGTALLMAAVIAGRAAPFDATLAAAAAATGATTLTALALPRVTPRQPHPAKEMRQPTRAERGPPESRFSRLSGITSGRKHDMRTNTDTSDSNTSETTTRAGAMSRRTLAGGAIGAGLLAASALQVSRAQTDSSATPEADTDATPAIVTIDERNADRVDAWIERASTAITTARTDRDAVASQIDTETIDSVLDQAEHLRDEAQDASDTGDALRFAAAATVTAGAGQRLILAELAYTGLPSQEAPASRILERAHTVITEVTDAVAGEDEADVTFAVATAQEFYRTAYDAFGDGAYDRAARMARAAVALASVAVILTGSGAGLPRMGRGDAPGGIQMPFPPGMHDERGINGIEEGDGEPVTPPAPDFPAI